MTSWIDHGCALGGRVPWCHVFGRGEAEGGQGQRFMGCPAMCGADECRGSRAGGGGRGHGAGALPGDP